MCPPQLLKEDSKGVYFLCWGAGHAFAENYPEYPSEQDREEARQFFYTLKNALPCSICEHHYRDYYLNHLPDVESRESLVNWFIEVHNEVNRRTGKPILDRETARKKIYFHNHTNWTAVSSYLLDCKLHATEREQSAALEAATPLAVSPNHVSPVEAVSTVSPWVFFCAILLFSAVLSLIVCFASFQDPQGFSDQGFSESQDPQIKKKFTPTKQKENFIIQQPRCDERSGQWSLRKID